jgi:hypothetical protein
MELLLPLVGAGIQIELTGVEIDEEAVEFVAVVMIVEWSPPVEQIPLNGEHSLPRPFALPLGAVVVVPVVPVVLVLVAVEDDRRHRHQCPQLKWYLW